MIPKLQECTIVGLFGPVSSGKSHLIKQWFNRMERGIAIDPTAEFFGENYTHVWGNPQELCQILAKNPYYYRIAYHPTNISSAFYWCSNAIWQTSGTRWLICDEVHEVCASRSVDPMCASILRYCRHNFLGFIGASQRISGVDKLLTSNARMCVIFYTEEAADLDAVADRWGPDAANKVANLRPLIYDDENHNVEQTPQALVIVRGQGFEVVDIGDEVKIKTGETNKWHAPLVDEQEPKMDAIPAELSLEQNSGNPEQK